ncbi:hypothetical protein HOY80DRAFT_993426 [Tuber brumale]|nr:hypothetical protein HOY80DRAFT_993426 [Tuber brumale]
MVCLLCFAALAVVVGVVGEGERRVDRRKDGEDGGYDGDDDRVDDGGCVQGYCVCCAVTKQKCSSYSSSVKNHHRNFLECSQMTFGE